MLYRPSTSPKVRSNTRRSSHELTMANPVDIDLLIIGAGPAGLSLACFLGSYG